MMDSISFYSAGLLVSMAGIIAAAVFSLKLSQETKHERYWLCLALGIIFFGLNAMSDIPYHLQLISNDLHFIIGTITNVTASILILYSSRGLYLSLKRIRERTT